MAFDPNSLNSQIDKVFGAGAYNSGINNARKAGRLKTEVSIAKQKFNKYVSELQQKQKKDQEYLAKYGMTYDAYQEKKAADKKLKEDDKKKLSDGTTSEQRQKMRKKAEAQGRGGYQPSYDNARREARKNDTEKGKSPYTKNPSSYDINKLTPYAKQKIGLAPAWSDSKKKSSKSKSKKKDTGLLGKLTKGIKDVGSEIGSATKAAEQWVNPFDKVSQAQAVKNYMNRKPSKTAQEIERGANRVVDSASLGIMSNLDKKVNKRTPYYTSERKIGKGGGTDMVSSALGYLIPYGGAYKAVNGISSLTRLGEQSLGKRLLAEGIKGAVTAGGVSSAEVGVKEALNPKDQNWKDNAKYIGTNVALGSVADPLLYGAGKVAGNTLAKFAKGDVPTYTGKPSSSVLDALTPSKAKGKANSNNLFDSLIMKAKQPKYEVPVSDRVPVDPKVQSYKNEFNQAVEQQYEYLKNSMGKGVDSGTTSNGLGGNFKEVNGRYSVSNNPKWYQDFYKANGRKPTDAELKELAKDHVLNGFQDELGNIPSYAPKSVQEIDNQLSEIDSIIQGQPEQAPVLKPIIDALQQERQTAMNEFKQAITNQPSVSETDNSNMMFTDPSFLQFFSEKTQKIINELTPIVKKMLANNPKADVEQMFLDAAKENGIDLKALMDQDLAKTGKSYASITAKTRKIGNKAAKQSSNGLKDLTAEGTTQEKKAASALLDNERQNSGDAESFRARINDTPKKEKKNILENLRTQFAEDVYPGYKYEKTITGKIDSAENSLYKTMRTFKGSPEKAHLVVKEQLDPIFHEMDQKGIDIKDLRDYALAVHAKDVNEKGINSGFTNAEINDVIQKLGSPEMEVLRKKLVSVNDYAMKLLSSGDNPVIDPALVKDLKEKWPNYMSLFRSFNDDKVEFGSGIGRSMVNATNPLKRLEGSDRKVIDPMESLIKNVFKAVNTADRNQVSSQVAKLAEKDVARNFIRKIEPGEDVKRLNVIHMMDNGKKVQYEVPPDLYKALKSLDQESTNTLVKILQKPASMLRAGATLTPEFSLRNPMRDVANAFITSESGFNPVTDFPVGLWQSIWKGRSIKIGNKTFKTSGELYKEFIKENGGYGNIISMDRNMHQKLLKQALNDHNLDYVDVLNIKTYKSLLNKYKNPLNVLRKISDISETATKVGEFRAAKRSGATPQEAAYRARDLMDFARAGSSIREANKVVAFLNANIQGKSKLLRAFKANPTRFMGKAVTAVTIPTIGAIVAQNTFANNKQRQIIDDAPQWLKDSFYLLPIPGTNQIARIPKPFDLAYPFSNMIERAADFAFKNDKHAFDNFIKNGFSSAAVPVMLTGLSPFVEGMTNYSFFRQGPIIPEREKNIDYPDQYDVNTSEVAKALGKGINTLTGGTGSMKNFGSPRVIDNTIQGLFGGTGSYATSSLDWILNNTGAVNNPARPAKSIDQKPLARAFLVNQSSTGKSMDTLYNMKDKLSRARGSAKEHNQPFKQEGQYQLANQATKNIGQISSQIRTIQNSPTMAAEEKKKMLDQLIEQRNIIALRTMQRLNQMK